MKSKIAIAILPVILSLTSPAMAQVPGRDIAPIDPSGDVDTSQTTAPLPPDPEGRAEDLRLQGKCDEAIPILRRFSDSDDIARYNLGLCLIDVGKAETNAQHAASLEHEGVHWVLIAANNGLPNAQSSLVTIYLDGSGVDKDPAEAGKWSLLYQGNGTRLALGLPNIAEKLQTRLNSTLTDAEWSDARARAAAWTPTSHSSAEN